MIRDLLHKMEEMNFQYGYPFFCKAKSPAMIHLLLKWNVKDIPDMFGRSSVVAAIREGKRHKAFILLSGGCKFQCEKYFSDWKEQLVEFCQAAREMWEFYEAEIDDAFKQKVVSGIIWEFLVYFPRNHVAKARQKVEELLQEESDNDFWEL